MPKDEQPQTFHFIFTIASVKMKVKFPCKMAIEQTGHPLTKEVQPNEEGKFVFNQQVRLREDSEKMFAELNVCLVTEKGARYISGTIKLYHNELIRAEGDRLVVTLSKCLDPEALCEIKVEKVVREGGQRKRTLTTIPERNQKGSRPNDEANGVMGDFKSPQRLEQPMIASETKSQAQFPVTSNMRFRKDQSEFRSKEYMGIMGQTANGKRYGNPSPKSKARQANSKTKHQAFEFNGQFDRDKLIEAEVYKDNYQKLKHKYLRETENSKNELSRRMMLQNNENNYKLEIVRLKLRNEELEKSISDKNAKLKEYASSLVALQGRESEINFMREDLANKDHSMQIMEETIIALSKQNDELRATNKDIAFKLQEKIMILESEFDTADARSLSKQQDLEREVKMLTETLQFKDGEVTRKNEMLEKEKRNVYELERSLQNKLFQYDSLMQTERANCKQRIDEIKSKVEESNQVIIRLNNEKGELVGELDKLKGLILKGEYEFKLYQQEMSNLRSQVEELRPLKDKYNQVFKELRIISEQKITIEKNHEKFMHSKENAIQEITSQYRKEIEFQKRNVKDLEERNKNLSSKLIESDGQLQIARGSLEKLKRNHDNLNKDFTEIKQKQKGMKKALKLKEEECEDIKKEVNRLKQKNQAIFQSMKGEMSKVREELGKTKIELESQAIKNQQLMETNSQISMQLARLKMTQQFSEQKYDKLMASAQEKYSQFQKIIKEHEGVIELLEEKIKAQKDNEKDYYGKLQKCDYEVNLVVDKNDKIIKEVRTIEERNRQLEFNLKNKQTELAETLKKYSQLQFKFNDSQDKATQLKENFQIAKNELQKSKKIIEILQRDYDKAKMDIISFSQRMSDKERQLEQRLQQSRKDKQTISSIESKFSASKKEYDRFKDSVTEALNSSFTQILHTFSMEKQDSSRMSTLASIDYSNGNVLASKRGLADLSNDLVSVINMAGKENKGQISRLTDRTKQLERDLEMVKTELDRNLELSKRQNQQKSHYIQQLQQQLRNIKNDKGESQVQYQMQIGELQQCIKQYQNECHSILTAKNELEFSVTSLKMESQRMADEFDRKIHQIKKERLESQQKLEYQYHSTQIIQKKVHELEIELMEFKSAIVLEKESSYKKELKIQQLEEERQKLARDIDTFKRQVKQCEEKYSELEIHYITVTEIKTKYESMLSEEESKLKDIRSFNNNILKQKEEIIKKELQKNIQIANLENAISELRHSLQQEETSKNKFKSDYEETKQNSRRFAQQIKQLETNIAFEKNRYNEIRDKLREKQGYLNEVKDQTITLKKKIEEGGIKNKNLIEELKQENEMISRQLETITAQANQKIRSLEGQLFKAGQQLQVSKQEIGELQEQIFVERENNQSMQDSINKLKAELDDYAKRIEEKEHAYDQLMEQNRQKDESMFEMGGKIYEYEGRMREMQEEKLREIQEINNNLNVKYDQDYQEIYQKIEFIQKEKEYFKEKYQEKEEVVARKNEELKHKEIEEMELKRVYEQKIKKLEEEKLVIFTDKNKEVAKVLEENKTQFENLRLKQSQNRKVIHELQISRTTIQKLQAKVKQMQNDKNSQVKVYQNEIENLRKKELTFKSYKDLIRSNQWNCEREVRKHIQNFIKKILEIGEKEVRNENVISLIKGLEEGLLGAIGTISKE